MRVTKHAWFCVDGLLDTPIEDDDWIVAVSHDILLYSFMLLLL